MVWYYGDGAVKVLIPFFFLFAGPGDMALPLLLLIEGRRDVVGSCWTDDGLPYLLSLTRRAELETEDVLTMR